jgi:hypothetical protein
MSRSPNETPPSDAIPADGELVATPQLETQWQSSGIWQSEQTGRGRWLVRSRLTGRLAIKKVASASGSTPGVAVMFAWLFHVYGFIEPPKPDTYWTSLLYSFRSTLSLSGEVVTLNAWGDLLQALLRITGPVLLGLGLLALRGRVKR